MNACVNACWFCCARKIIIAVYDKQLRLCMLYCNAFSFSILFLQILCLYMFMGLLAQVFEAYSRVLFAGRRHGDVTAWYQSSWVAAVGLYGTRRTNWQRCISFCLAESVEDCENLKLGNFCLSVNSRKVSWSSCPPLRRDSWSSRPLLRKDS